MAGIVNYFAALNWHVDGGHFVSGKLKDMALVSLFLYVFTYFFLFVTERWLGRFGW